MIFVRRISTASSNFFFLVEFSQFLKKLAKRRRMTTRFCYHGTDLVECTSWDDFERIISSIVLFVALIGGFCFGLILILGCCAQAFESVRKLFLSGARLLKQPFRKGNVIELHNGPESSTDV